MSGDESDRPGFRDFYGLPQHGAWWPPRGLRYVPLRCCNRVRLDIGDSETAARLTADLQVDEIAERFLPFYDRWGCEDMLHRDATALHISYCDGFWHQRDARAASAKRLAKVAGLAEALSAELANLTRAESREIFRHQEEYYSGIEADKLWSKENRQRQTFETDLQITRMMLERISSAADTMEAQKPARGQRRALLAEQVSLAAGRLFNLRSGHRPTITTNPDTSRVTGQWRDFLSAVFCALGVDGADVGYHARKISEKMASELAN